MRARLRRNLSAYASAREKREDLSLLEFLRERDPYLFAHHPATEAFRTHVWKFKGFYLCKGCVLSTAGILLGGLVYLATQWLDNLSEGQTAIAFIALLLPTFANAFLPLPPGIRHLSKLLLGVLTASAAIFICITDNWVARLTVVVVYLIVRGILSRRRKDTHQAPGKSTR